MLNGRIAACMTSRMKMMNTAVIGPGQFSYPAAFERNWPKTP